MSERKLPELSAAPVNPACRQRLARWLREWEIAGALEADASESSAHQRHVVPEALPRDADGAALGEGQVRLLQPRGGVTSHRLLYVAVLREAGDGSWLTVPFGRFAEPAVPGEWLTGYKSAPLRVLCVWNAVVLRTARLQRSWHISDLAAPERMAACRLYDALQQNRPVPDELRPDVGPVLVHPDDPRQIYLNRERLAFRRATVELGVYGADCEAVELPRAAEDRSPYGVPDDRQSDANMK